MDDDNDSYRREHDPDVSFHDDPEHSNVTRREQYPWNENLADPHRGEPVRRDRQHHRPLGAQQPSSYRRRRPPRQDYYQREYRDPYDGHTPDTREPYRVPQRQDYYDDRGYQDYDGQYDGYDRSYAESYADGYPSYPQSNPSYPQPSKKKGARKPVIIILSIVVIVAAIILIAMLVNSNGGQKAKDKDLTPQKKQAAAQVVAKDEKSDNQADRNSTDCTETKSFMGLTFKIPEGWKIDPSLTNNNDDSEGEWVVYSYEGGDNSRLITLGCFAGDSDSALVTNVLGSENIIDLLISSFASEDFFVDGTVEHSTDVIAGHQARTISGISDSSSDRKTYVTIFSDGFNYFVLSTSANNNEQWIDELHPKMLQTIKADKTYMATPKSQVEEKSTVDLAEKVDKKEYMYISSGFSNYYYGVAIVTNNNDVDVSISGQGKFLNGGQTVSLKDDDISVVGPGQTSILYFITDATSDEFFCDIKVTEAKYYDDVLADLDYTSEIAGDRAIVSVTNNGNRPAEFVQGYVLFFNQGYLVDSDWTYYTDDDSEIKVGDTISKEHKVYSAFDSIEVYFKGRAPKY